MDEKERMDRIRQIQEQNQKLSGQRQQVEQNLMTVNNAIIANNGRIDELQNKRWEKPKKTSGNTSKEANVK